MLLELEKCPPSEVRARAGHPVRAACWEQREDTLQNYIRGKGLIFSAPANLNKIKYSYFKREMEAIEATEVKG